MVKGRNRYTFKTDRETGIRFVFSHDPDAPELLHIYVRHMTTPDDAIATFKKGSAVWSQRYERFESQTDTHTLYWFWLDFGSTVMVISCFSKEGGTWKSE